MKLTLEQMDPSTFSKKPTFHVTSVESPITELALAIDGYKNEEHYPSGSAIMVGKNMAITAGHVIRDFYKRFEGNCLGVRPNTEVAGTFNIQLLQFVDHGKSAAIWNVRRLWICNFTDIAVLEFTPRKGASNHRWKLPVIDLIPPDVGERITSFGYKSPVATKEGDKNVWGFVPTTSIGEVREVHDQKRDDCRLPFPCFRTNARYDGAMSGGPVFNDSGKLCGIVCSNLPPADSNEEHASYVTSLWPLMGLMMDINRAGHPKGIKYAMLELARDGFIPAEGWERINLVTDRAGNVARVGLRLGQEDNPLSSDSSPPTSC